MTMRRRIEALETGSGQDLSPEVMRWLGWPVGGHEGEDDVDLAAIDTSGFSKELKTWLGRD